MEFNEENQKKVPRARKANFSMLEESILQREVENNFDVLRDKHSNSVTNLEKARIWKNVTSKINALGVAPRSVKEIKDKWRNLTSKAKSAFTEYRREKNMTGGGPAPKKPTSSVEKIVNMMQDTASFAGNEGGLQTTGFINEQKDHRKQQFYHQSELPGICVDQNTYDESDCSLSQDLFSTPGTSPGLMPTQGPSQPVEAIVKINKPAVPPKQTTKSAKVVKRKHASHEDVLDLQVKVLKGQLEEQKLNKLKLELQIDILKKYSSNEYILSSSQMALFSSII